LRGGTLRQAGLLSRATASDSWRKNIGLSKLSPDSTLYHVAERGAILSFFLSFYTHFTNTHILYTDEIVIGMNYNKKEQYLFLKVLVTHTVVLEINLNKIGNRSLFCKSILAT
jgi:hypothetical protein